MKRRNAFSLVELSIVLVILGLLTGGILAGQSLIRAAELRAVTSDYQRYVTAVQAFRDKYFSLPGDFSNATMVWGKDNTNCSGNTGTAATPGTCNGNGDNVLDVATSVSSTGETLQFWKQLALAGLIEGNYTGIAGPTAGWTGNDTIPGTNGPRSRIPNSGWGDGNNANSGGSATAYAYDYANFLGFGALNPGSIPDAALLKPEEAWNIDTKMDDGKPGSGRIFARDVVGFGNAGSCTTSSSKTDYTGLYNLSSSTIACAFKFIRGF